MRELKGVKVKELRRCAESEVEARGRRLHIYTRDLVRRLRGADYFLVAVSGSPEEILNTFTKHLGFHRSFGTLLAQDEQGRYTGRPIRETFREKRRVLEGFLEETRMGLEGSVGVGDTLSDVGFLEAVMNSIKNGLEMRKTWIAKTIGRPWNPHFYGVFTQVHNTL